MQRNKKLRQPPESEGQDSGKKSIIQTLLDEYNKQSSIKDKQSPVEDKQPPVKDKQPPDENSITRQLLKNVNQSWESNVQRHHARYFFKIMLLLNIR